MEYVTLQKEELVALLRFAAAIPQSGRTSEASEPIPGLTVDCGSRWRISDRLETLISAVLEHFGRRNRRAHIFSPSAFARALADYGGSYKALRDGLRQTTLSKWARGASSSPNVNQLAETAAHFGRNLFDFLRPADSPPVGAESSPENSE